jgi:hypothetical protein
VVAGLGDEDDGQIEGEEHLQSGLAPFGIERSQEGDLRLAEHLHPVRGEALGEAGEGETGARDVRPLDQATETLLVGEQLQDEASRLVLSRYSTERAGISRAPKVQKIARREAGGPTARRALEVKKCRLSAVRSQVNERAKLSAPVPSALTSRGSLARRLIARRHRVHIAVGHEQAGPLVSYGFPQSGRVARDGGRATRGRFEIGDPPPFLGRWVDVRPAASEQLTLPLLRDEAEKLDAICQPSSATSLRRFGSHSPRPPITRRTLLPSPANFASARTMRSTPLYRFSRPR